MASKYKSVAKHTIIYSIGNLSTKLIGLVLLPLYTSHLSTSDYGILSVLEITSQLLTAIIGLNLSKAMMRWVAVEKVEKNKKGIVLSTYIAVLSVVVVFSCLMLFSREYFASFFFGNSEYKTYFSLLTVWVSFEIINRVTLDLLRLKERSLFFILLIVLKFSSILALNIYFVAFREMGVEGIIASQAIGNALVFLITIILIVKSIRGAKPDFFMFREMLKYSTPLVFSTISTMILTMTDRYLLKLLGTYSQVGIYSLGYKIAGVINVFIIQSFQLGFLPVAYKMFQDNDAKPFFARITSYLLLILFVTALGISAFSREVIILFSSKNEAYWIAYTIVPIISFTFVLRGLNYIFSLGLHYVKQTKYNAYIVFLAAIFNIILNFVLIPLTGIYGAAFATVAANLLMVFLFYWKSQKAYPIRYEKRRMIVLFVSGITALLVVSLIDLSGDYSWWRTMLKACIVIIYPLLLFATGFFNKDEQRLMKGAWKKWKNPGAFIENIKRIT